MTTIMTPSAGAVDAAALAGRLDGEVVTPSDPGWPEARLAWNLAADQRPAAVVLAESAADVAATVQFAAASGLRVAVQGTGHGAGAMGDLGDAILLKTARMRRVEIDPQNGVARAEAGALWIEVTEAAAEHGLAALAGSSPDVGVVGYTLGGGLSWLGRRHGLSANNVVAIEVVTADGRLRRVDHETEPELFWALRGGGGNYAAVTAIELRLFPIREVYAGAMFWPIERASEILQAWRRFTEDVPEELSSVGRLLQLPPLPDIPEFLRGRSFVLVEVAYIGDEASGAELVRPLRELGPEIDTLATIPVQALSRLHMDPEHPVPGVGDGMLLSELPAEAVDAIVEVAGPGTASPLLSLEVRQLGGALKRGEPDHGALATLDAGFALFAVGIAMNPQMTAAVHERVGLVRDALAPWDAGFGYMNFSERAGDASGLYPAQIYRRLQAAKALYDPENRFRANHEIAA